MKLSDAKPVVTFKPTIKTHGFELTVLHDDNKIHTFRATVGKVTKEFAVGRDGSILKAWQEVERFAQKLK